MPSGDKPARCRKLVRRTAVQREGSPSTDRVPSEVPGQPALTALGLLPACCRPQPPAGEEPQAAGAAQGRPAVGHMAERPQTPQNRNSIRFALTAPSGKGVQPRGRHSSQPRDAGRGCRRCAMLWESEAVQKQAEEAAPPSLRWHVPTARRALCTPEHGGSPAGPR